MSAQRIGILMAGDKSYPAYAAFLDELDLASKAEGLTCETIERFAEGRHELLPSLAAELASAKPDLIVAVGAVSFYAVRSVIGDTIPVVFVIVLDPFAAGIASPESHRGGNFTGVTSFNSNQTFEQVRLLKETIGGISTIAVIGDADAPPLLPKIAETAALALGMRPVIRLLRSPGEIERTIADFRDAGATALLGLEVPRINTHCVQITEAATAAGLPTVLGWDMARAAPLLAYGTSLSRAARRAAKLAVRFCGNEGVPSPPIEFETAMNLTVNLVTAKRLGVEVPPSVLDAAERVQD